MYIIRLKSRDQSQPDGFYRTGNEIQVRVVDCMEDAYLFSTFEQAKARCLAIEKGVKEDDLIIDHIPTPCTLREIVAKYAHLLNVNESV